MRNLSMKKFGTPIGAGPGVASEKPGFAGVGVPSARSVGAGTNRGSRPGRAHRRVQGRRAPAEEEMVALAQQKQKTAHAGWLGAPRSSGSPAVAGGHPDG